jgi:hypothetical protein
MVIYGIEIDKVEPGVGLSSAVDKAVDEVAASIVQLCSDYA